MAEENAAAAIYDGHMPVEEAVRSLHGSAFDLEKVSIAGKDERDATELVSYYCGVDGMQCWGRRGRFWGQIWDMLTGWALVDDPAIGPVLVAGPLAGWTFGALENAVVFDGFTPLGAGMYNAGLPRESVLNCESALRDGRYVLLVHGPSGDVSRARQILGI